VKPDLRGFSNRLLQVVALYAPGGDSTRVALHRLRGVSIGNRVAISIRVLILAHFAHQGRNRETSGGELEERVSVRIEDDAFIGPGAVIMPNVTIGAGAVVTAGSVVTRSVAPLTMVQGNPAKPIARCGIPLGLETPIKEFYRRLTPIKTPSD
jgi:acetyltransferase-like isoleucine patch superfamily enzyme